MKKLSFILIVSLFFIACNENSHFDKCAKRCRELYPTYRITGDSYSNCAHVCEEKFLFEK